MARTRARRRSRRTTPDGSNVSFAANKSELAAALGVNRRTVTRWFEDPTHPEARPDGRLSVIEWQAWVDVNGKKSDGNKNPTQTELKSKQIALQNQKLEYQVKILRKEYSANKDVEQWVGEMVAQAKRVLLGGPQSLAPQVIGIQIHEAEAMLRQWVHDVLARLSAYPTGGDEQSETTVPGGEPNE